MVQPYVPPGARGQLPRLESLYPHDERPRPAKRTWNVGPSLVVEFQHNIAVSPGVAQLLSECPQRLVPGAVNEVNNTVDLSGQSNQLPFDNHASYYQYCSSVESCECNLGSTHTHFSHRLLRMPYERFGDAYYIVVHICTYVYVCDLTFEKCSMVRCVRLVICSANTPDFHNLSVARDTRR